MPSSTVEYKLQAVWSIKKETFMKKRPIGSKKLKTTLPNNVVYNFSMQFDEEYSAIWIQLRSGYASIKEMNLSILSASYVEELSLQSAIAPHDGVVFIKSEDLLDPEKKFFVNGILTMEFRGTVSYKKRNGLSLGYHLWCRDDKDFTFIVGEERIEIHKIILDSYSSVLAKDHNSNEVVIENFGAVVVDILVRLCYELDKEWYYHMNVPDRHNVFLKLIEFTNVYDMPEITEHLEIDSPYFIKPENVCEMANKSIELKSDTLRTYCINFMSNCLKDRKPFDGYADLHPEIMPEVFKDSVCPSQLS